MYELLIETSFRARHALRLGGEWEEPHWHDWEVVVRYTGAELDEDGLLADFHALEADLTAVVRDLNEQDLNTCEAFAGVNPSAERVARHLAEVLAERHAEPRCAIADVTVTEAPGCRARYRLPGSP